MRGAGSAMFDDQSDKRDKLGPLLTEIGQELAVMLDRYPEGALLFVEAGDGWVGGAVFIEEERAVRWMKPSHEIFELVRKLWAADNAERSASEGWIFMEYDVRDGRFHGSFTYRDQVAPGSDSDDWEDAAVAKRFGDKPVIYPPMPETGGGQPDKR